MKLYFSAQLAWCLTSTYSFFDLIPRLDCVNSLTTPVCALWGCTVMIHNRWWLTQIPLPPPPLAGSWALLPGTSRKKLAVVDTFLLLQEEEDGSEDDGDSKTQFSVSVRADVSVLSFLDYIEEDADGFISPVDELTTSKNTTDMRLSNLHSATT